MGWNICTKMAAFHDVTVLCASGSPLNPFAYRKAVYNYFDVHGKIAGLHVVFVDQPDYTLKCAAINRTLFDTSDGVGNRFIYYSGLDAWHRAALGKAHDLNIEQFDIVHQLTPISFLRSGYLWTINKPFVWGPIGGMYKVPMKFARWCGVRSMLFESIRSINIELQFNMSRCFRNAAEKADIIWTVSDDEPRKLLPLVGKKTVPMIDSAPPFLSQGIIKNYDGIRPLKICWSGRHSKPKALPLLLEAIAGLPDPTRVTLEILGGGTETEKWQSIAHQLGLKNILWYGQMAYKDALKKMSEADVFVHSSIREAASHVVLEALGFGLPVICHDICGMAIAVDDTCGIKVPFVSPEQSIRGFRGALQRLLMNHELVTSLAKGALHRAAILSWDAKVKEISEGYIRCHLSSR